MENTERELPGRGQHVPIRFARRIWNMLWMSLMDVPLASSLKVKSNLGLSRCGTMAASAEQHKDIQVHQQEKPACAEMQRSDMFSQPLQPNNEIHLIYKCTSMVHLAKPLATEERNTSHLHMHRHGFTTHVWKHV